MCKCTLKVLPFNIESVEIGFIYLSNHGIPEEQVKKSFALSKEFFQLPKEEKEALAWTTPESNRGYVSQGREKTSLEAEKHIVDQLRAFPDLKESFEIGKEPSSDFQNNWPGDSKYQKHFMEFFKTCHLLHLKIMNAIALGFSLPDGYFDRFCDQMDHNLRLLHYPAVPKSILDRKEQNRTGAHTDYGSLTLLFQDDRGGLGTTFRICTKIWNLTLQSHTITLQRSRILLTSLFQHHPFRVL